MSFQDRLDKLLAGSNILDNLPRKKLIQASVDNKEVFISKCGALATWTPPESTGRSPLDTLMVKRIAIDGGPTLKRYIPRAMGRATMVRKRTSHVTVVLDEK